MTPEQQFAANMKRKREALGWSQATMAKAMQGCGYRWYAATVWTVEAGQRKIPLNEAVTISAVLLTTLDWMLKADALVKPQVAR